MTLSLAAALPVITVQRDEAITNSRDVAVFFGKQHFNILQAIDGLGCSPEFRQLNFQATNESRLTGRAVRDLRSFNMTKDGFAFLVMGFTGKKAAAFKEASIARFNELELGLRQMQLANGTKSASSIRDHL